MDIETTTQIELAKKLLKSVRHAAYATVNADGTPHNSPLMLIYNEDLSKLYIGSHSDSLHVKNLLRTGAAYVVIYDSFTKGQGVIYIAGNNGHECKEAELNEALRVHNSVRAKQGSQPIPISFYQRPYPAQRMYCIEVARIEVYSLSRDTEGLIVCEERVVVEAAQLLPEPIHA